MMDKVYYLSSLESTTFKPVRLCRFGRLLTFDTGKFAVEATLSPGLVGQPYERTSDVNTVILAPRHEGVDLRDVNEFPCFVFIATSRMDLEAISSPIRSDDLTVIGWGELYRTELDAATHSFG